MPILVKTLLTGILLICTTGPLLAQESMAVHPLLTSEFFGDLGVYMPERNLTFSVNGTVSGINEDIDFAEDLQAKRSENVFALDFGWRFGEKWSLRTQYFANSPSQTAVLSNDIEWNDLTFGAGSNVTVGSEFSLLRLFFGRSFESSERTDFGIGAGIHWLEMGAFIEGEAIINGMTSGIRRESVSAEAPLPNIGAWYMYSISPRWAASARVDWFAASISDFDGSLVNVGLGLNFAMLEHAGIGLSYNVIDLDLDVTKTDWNGSVSTRYSGLYANLSFYW